MSISEFVSNFKNHIILFVGTGMSLRYFEKSYSWMDLLESSVIDLTGSKEDFLIIKNRHFMNGSYDLPAMAGEIDTLFTQRLEGEREGKFKEINDMFFEQVEKGIKSSRFKIYLSELLHENQPKEDKQEELVKMKKMQKNIGSVITTNYDNLIEQVYGFSPLIGNDILLSNPYGSVYKIHGSIETPESLIITSDDYGRFEDSYDLIRSQIISMFIHNPIVFLGYSLGDKNIKMLLKTIFKFVSPSSEEAEKIKQNFLVVEYDEGNANTEVQDFECTLDENTSIVINRTKTDNFSEIYDSISNLILPISAMDVKKVRDIVSLICEGTDGIKVYVTADMDSLNNSDKVLAIGSKQSVSVNYMNSSEMIQNYFEIIDNRDIARTEIIKHYKITVSQFFPIYGFLNINPGIENSEQLKLIEDQKISETKTKALQHTCVYDTIKDILDDDDIVETKKNWTIINGVFEGKIRLEDLKSYLLSFEDRTPTELRKLTVVYDYLQYK